MTTERDDRLAHSLFDFEASDYELFAELEGEEAECLPLSTEGEAEAAVTFEQEGDLEADIAANFDLEGPFDLEDELRRGPRRAAARPGRGGWRKPWSPRPPPRPRPPGPGGHWPVVMPWFGDLVPPAQPPATQPANAAPQSGSDVAASATSPESASDWGPSHGDPVTQDIEEVRWLQDTLNRVTGAGIAITGRIDAATRNAVRQFQAQARLPVTGYVGPDTKAALMRRTAPGTPAEELDLEADLGADLETVDEYENGPMTAAHAGGAMGEADAAFALGEKGFGIVIGPGGSAGHRLTASGFDIVAFNPRTRQVWIVDNKASGGTSTVQSASALTTNLRQNLQDAIRQIQLAQAFPGQRLVVGRLKAALSAVNAGRPLPASVRLYITNAGGFHSGISGRLRGQGIRFRDLTGVAVRRARAADIRAARNQGVAPGRPTTHVPSATPAPRAPPARPAGTSIGRFPSVPPINVAQNPRGAAAVGGIMLGLQGVNFALNWLIDREQRALVEARLREIEPSIAAERQRLPDHGVILLIYYHQVIAPRDSLIQPAAVFSHIRWAIGRTQDEAMQNLASRASIDPAPPQGSRALSSRIWIPPLQRSGIETLRTPFPRAGLGTFAPNRAVLQDVGWNGINGFDDEGTTRLSAGSFMPRFLLLDPPSEISWVWGQRLMSTSIPLVQRAAANRGPAIKAVDLDPVVPFGSVSAVPVFPYDEQTDLLFAAAPATADNLGQLRQFPNLGKMRWVRPENIVVVPAFR